MEQIRAAKRGLKVARAHAFTFEALAALTQSALKVANSRDKQTRTDASSPGKRSPRAATAQSASRICFCCAAGSSGGGSGTKRTGFELFCMGPPPEGRFVQLNRNKRSLASKLLVYRLIHAGVGLVTDLLRQLSDVLFPALPNVGHFKRGYFRVQLSIC